MRFLQQSILLSIVAASTLYSSGFVQAEPIYAQSNPSRGDALYNARGIHWLLEGACNRAVASCDPSSLALPVPLSGIAGVGLVKSADLAASRFYSHVFYRGSVIEQSAGDWAPAFHSDFDTHALQPATAIRIRRSLASATGLLTFISQ